MTGLNRKNKKLYADKIMTYEIQDQMDNLIDHPYLHCNIIRRKFKFDMKIALNVFQKMGTIKLHSQNIKYAIDQRNRWVIEQLIKWVEGDDTMQAITMNNNTKLIKGSLTKGLYIAGPTGTGKTLAVDILNEFTEIDYIPINLNGKTFRLKWQSIRAADICQEYSQYGEIDKWKKCAILCIHDLGAEKLETMYMGNRTEVLREIIEYRGDNDGLITIITSNVKPEKLISLYGARVASRISGMCNYFILRGEDRRMLYES